MKNSFKVLLALCLFGSRLQPATANMAPHPFLTAETVNFSLDSIPPVDLRPVCLERNGVELIVLDPGHDDSPDSTRSEGRDSPRGRKYFGRPRVHEGRLNQVTAWLVYELLMKNPNLSSAEQTQLQSMIRFSRHPGEKVFGEYEKKFSYSDSTQGLIDAGITHRRDRVNFMMRNHKGLDVSAHTVFLSIHANNTDEVYDAEDLSWVVTPKNSQGNPAWSLGRRIAAGFSEEFSDYSSPAAQDSSETLRLKKEVSPSFRLSEIKIGAHWEDLAMLSSELGNSDTIKLMLEGFMMSGKAGHLANLDILQKSQQRKIKFTQGGREGSREVASYDYSPLYLSYAQAIVRALGEVYACTP